MSWPARLGTIAQPSGAQYQLWMMGSTAFGVLDNNQSSIQLTPKLVAQCANNRYVSSSLCGSDLGGSNEEFAYLISSSKQCGFMGSTRRTSDDTNRKINTLLYNNGNFSGSKFRFVSAGNRDATFITTDGKLWWAYGENNGNMSLALLDTSTNWKVAATAGVNNGWDGQRCAIKTDGTLWARGYTATGTIATSSVSGFIGTISKVGTATDWDDVKSSGSGGNTHMLARKTGGSLWGWGLNSSGQIGDNSITNRSSPVQIGALTTWTKFAVGSYHSVAIRSDGTLWSWGNNTYGQLGHGGTTNRSSPTQVGALTTWADVYCGPYNTFAIKTDGTLWSWGRNSRFAEDMWGGGMLGVGDGTDRNSPVQVGTDTDWTNAIIGSSHGATRAIKSTGILWSWGSNQYNCTLQSECMNLSFNQIPTTNWSSSRLMSCNRQLREDGGTIALKRDNTLWYWGLYNPTTNESIYSDAVGGLRSSPVQIGTGSNWSNNFDIGPAKQYYFAIDRNNKLWSLATGTNNQTIAITGSWSKVTVSGDIFNAPPQNWSLIISTTGQLWSIGYNASGQLGNNTTTTNFSNWARVGTLANWKDITTGTDQSVLAVKTDGTLWAWGRNEYGQLGLGDVASRSSPVQVGTGTTWKYVSCRSSTTHAIKTDGTLWAWGYNDDGRMGNSSTIRRSSPVQVGTDTNWKQVESYGATIGLKTNGTLYIWGASSYITTTPAGTLPWNVASYKMVGNGTTSNLSSPVQIGFGWNTWTHVSAGIAAVSAVATR